MRLDSRYTITKLRTVTALYKGKGGKERVYPDRERHADAARAHVVVGRRGNESKAHVCSSWIERREECEEGNETVSVGPQEAVKAKICVETRVSWSKVYEAASPLIRHAGCAEKLGRGVSLVIASTPATCAWQALATSRSA